MAVHPRVRGEQGDSRPLNSSKVGSSPRARGTVCRELSPSAYHRFIPACAGNSPFSKRYFAQRAVHPRVRGEQP